MASLPTCEICGEPFHFCPYASDVFCRCDLEASQTEARAAIDSEFDRLHAATVAVTYDEGGFADCPW
jgi:hypothetical protein